jgi:dTDP-L-rhamnose 4-epimerase
MHLLVTGGAGFIGQAVVRAALEAGHDVRVLDRAPRSGPDGVGSPDPDGAQGPDGVEVVTGDVTDPGTVARALRGVDAVSHQAARVGLGVDLDDLPGYVRDNAVGTATLLAGMARAGVRRLVLAGSMVVYGEGRYRCDRHGDVPAPPRAVADLQAGRFEPRCPACRCGLVPALVGEDAVPDPRNGYAVSKLAQEQLARVWAREAGGRAAILRYHNVYGPGLPRDTPYAGVAAIFGSALARGQAPAVFEDGGQRRDFVHVDDVAAANLAALGELGALAEPGASDGTRESVRVWNVASGTPRTVLDLAEALARAVGGPAPRVTGDFRLGDVRHVTADTARIRAELGWAPRVAFEDGMAALAHDLATCS